MKYIDYYEVLGVAKTATEKEIKTAYRKLAREHHPDLHQGEAKAKAEEKFKLINEAYEVLGDAEKRTKYDQLGSSWHMGQDFQPPPGGGYGYQNVQFDGMEGFSDFFSTLFGGDIFGHARGGRGHQRGHYAQGEMRGANIDAEIQLSIEDLMAGGEKEIAVHAATGRKTIKIKIPEKSYPGTALRLKGLGEKGYGNAPAGDLYLHVQAVPHPFWRVVDQVDLEGDLTIYPEQAVLGDKVSVPTPQGMVQVKIQPGIRSGQKLRLKDRGFRRKNGTHGDLYIRVKIDLPAQQSAEEIELYRQIFEIRNQA